MSLEIFAGITPETLGAVAAMAFAGTWSPGPNNAMLSASGARFGLRATLPHARSDGLSRQVGRAPSHAAWLAVLLALVIAVICSGAEALGAVIVALLAGLAVRWLARSKIGGQTGDILGATQQLTALAVLLGALIAA